MSGGSSGSGAVVGTGDGSGVAAGAVEGAFVSETAPATPPPSGWRDRPAGPRAPNATGTVTANPTPMAIATSDLRPNHRCRSRSASGWGGRKLRAEGSTLPAGGRARRGRAWSRRGTANLYHRDTAFASDVAGRAACRVDGTISRADAVAAMGGMRVIIRPCPPVAQWIRATDFGSVGRGFESLRAGHRSPARDIGVVASAVGDGHVGS